MANKIKQATSLRQSTEVSFSGVPVCIPFVASILHQGLKAQDGIPQPGSTRISKCTICRETRRDRFFRQMWVCVIKKENCYPFWSGLRHGFPKSNGQSFDGIESFHGQKRQTPSKSSDGRGTFWFCLGGSRGPGTAD